MKIFVDGSPFRFRTGVARYTENLLRELVRIDAGNQYTIFSFTRSWLEPPPIAGKNVDYKFISWFPRQIWNLLFRELGAAPPVDLLLGAKPDLFLFPNFVRLPLAGREKSIVIIYDLSFEKYPEFVGALNGRYLRRHVPKSARIADKVITISENSKQELIDFYGVDGNKIEVVYPAIDHRLFKPQPEAVVAKLRQKYGLPEKFVLFLGTIEPRKNLEGVLSAYSMLEPGLKNSVPLVLAGSKGWKDASILSAIESRGAAGDNIIQTGFIPDEDLPALYSAASLFVFPSFYEGFGIPPLEAMACGCPVVSADNSSLPEAVGKAGLLVDAASPEAIASAMARVLKDESLAAKLREAGFKQAAKFDWETSARKLKAVLIELSGND